MFWQDSVDVRTEIDETNSLKSDVESLQRVEHQRRFDLYTRTSLIMHVSPKIKFLLKIF